MAARPPESLKRRAIEQHVRALPVFKSVDGNFRRLEKLLRNVNAYALKLGHWVDEAIVRDAIEKLGPES